MEISPRNEGEDGEGV
jgi:hypothetical protein